MALSDALQIVSLTDTGQVRAHNEDSVVTLPEAGIVVLADGMGGHNAGEVASAMATASLAAGLSLSWSAEALQALGRNASIALSQELLDTHISNANAAIFAAAQENPDWTDMGTTVIAVLLHDDFLSVGHVGDSRLYRLRDEMLEQMTRDHSLLQEQLDAGVISAAEALLSNNKHWLTRAVGIEPDVAVTVNSHEVLEGDVFLLCSDGLYDMIDDSEIQLTLSALQSNLELCAEQLVQAANDAGGRDNVSVILVRVIKSFAKENGNAP